MVKKIRIFSLFIFMIILFSTNASALDVNFSDETSSLEKLASQRLHVYGIIDDVPENFDNKMTRGETIKLIYNMIPGEKESSEAPFADSVGEYKKYIDYFYSAGIVNGCTDGLFHPEQSIKQHHFLYILLKSFDSDVTFDNLDFKLAELGILKINNFSAGSIYTLISDFIDAKELEYDAVRNQISLPAVIELDIYSVEDGINKLKKAFTFGPEKINIRYFCGDDEIMEFYAMVLREQNISGWNPDGIFLFPEIFDSNIDNRFSYSFPLEEDKNEEYYKYSNNLWFDYSSNNIGIHKYLYLRNFYRLLVQDNKTVGVFEDLKFERNIYVNANATNWIDCLGPEYEERTNKILSDVESFKGLSDYEKIVKVNEYISNNASYDYEEMNRPDREQIDDYNEESHSILGFINSKEIVCDGYSETFHWLMNYLDVLTICQNGRVDGVEHQWNKIMLDGKWYNIDVCWNDTGMNLYKYFLKSDISFRKTHQTVHNFTHKQFRADEDHVINQILGDF